jgi:hypothetical protein
MYEEITESLTSKITGLQDKDGCWNVLKENDKYYPELNYYVPNYKSTLWTLVLLSEIQCDIKNDQFRKPLEIISNHFLDKQNNIYSVGKSHFPIPCLNGNMISLHYYFQVENEPVINSIIDFFAKYQRFDDGDFKTPSSFPYFSNRSCYGKHSCYWGIVKLLKGLSFIPKEKRSANAEKLIKKSIDFILLHEVCFSSHNKSDFIHNGIQYLSFPNMYHGDFLEVLWLLKREKIRSKHIEKALNLLQSKMEPDGTWKIEHSVKNLIIPISNKIRNEFLTRRAKEIMNYYSKRR